MTKKHFIELADVVREAEPCTQGFISERMNESQWNRHQQWGYMRDRLADFCARQNPRFNRERWLAYIAGECGESGGRVKGGAA